MGVLFHDFITGFLFNSVTVIAAALVVGGIVLVVLDRLPLVPRYKEVMDYPLRLAVGIGLFQ